MSPQTDNGFIKIANELFEAFYRCKLLEYERVVILAIWRKTYGFNKKEDVISLSQLEKQTGIPKSHVCRTIGQLRDKKIITLKGEKLGINKKYYEWVVDWRALPHQVMSITSSGNKPLPDQVYTKDNIKYTIQKTKEKQVSQSLSPISNPEISYNQNMKKNSFKYNESMHEDDFELAIDLDSGEEINPEPKKKVRKDADVINLQNAFIEICEQEIGIKPIKDAKGYMAVKNALQHIEYDEVIDMYERWFKISGRPQEDLIAITKCLSNDQLNKFRLQKEQGRN